MQSNPKQESLQTLQDIRGMMQRSARFLSLSGFSGIWAGAVALIGAAVAAYWLLPELRHFYTSNGRVADLGINLNVLAKAMLLSGGILVLALTGGYYFTARKASRSGERIWNHATRQLLWNVLLPMGAGGIMCLAFLYHGDVIYLAPACLIFYGLGLVNGSKYTLGDIRYLGYLEVALGGMCLFLPRHGLLFWAIGFGALHILYGIIMWNKYDKHAAD